MTSSIDFECMTCRTAFKGRFFDISRENDRVHYNSPSGIDEVEISGSEGIAVYCSQACLDLGRMRVMQEQGVPIPRVRPGIGPIEQCAKCDGPVDMSDWHVTYTDGICEDRGDAFSVIKVDYMAVVCKACVSNRGSAIAGSALEPDLQSRFARTA